MQPETAIARTTDPDESHQAAASVDLRGGHAKVYALLQKYGPSTHDELIFAAEREGWLLSPSGVRSRCHELVQRGLVVDTGVRLRLPTGRQAAVWKVAS